jgi:aminoglycoside 6'-N-acetyltransferase I
MIIRSVKKSDLNRWAELRNKLWPDSLESHKSELNDYFNGRSNDIVKVFVAETQEEIVGFIELNLRNFAEGSTARFVPYIEGWLIEKRYQNQGIGNSLIQKAEQWATESGFNELASDTELENKKSITIHGKLGFKEVERIVCFIKKLK